ncbi:Uncharacterised protein [Mycobacteroides abscessus subsp. abscessus]|nr:Uncharacterised protein [Mycobacteroides abscessus subsp. abscessus]SKU70184.1 Uncharacterised protein [Mycobacteroides abscessus subsp. abscessus]SLJ19883.1 Uncharacterised protein [Mycobacteroides abscessus subsp. abscessus]
MREPRIVPYRLMCSPPSPQLERPPTRLVPCATASCAGATRAPWLMAPDVSVGVISLAGCTEDSGIDSGAVLICAR